MAALALRDLAPTFDAFFVDVWGVLHDGERPFPSVIATLQALADAGRPVVLITNTSRLGDAVTQTLTDTMGIDRALFHDVVTAGDVTRTALEGGDPALAAALAIMPHCYHFGNPSFVPWLFEMGLAFTDDVDAADLILATGAVDDDAALAAACTLLEPAAARKVPLVCTNPDRIIPTADGPRFGPGAVARAYAELGEARVYQYGKPHAAIYAEARRRLGENAAERILAIGDTLETDIRGAKDAGHASALITGSGVHAAELRGGGTGDDVRNALFAREGVTPDFVLERFEW